MASHKPPACTAESVIHVVLAVDLQDVYSGSSVSLRLRRQPRATMDIADARGSLHGDARPLGSFFPTLGTCELLRSPTAQPPPVSPVMWSGRVVMRPTCSCKAHSAMELLAAASGSADTRIPSRSPRHSSLRFLLFSIKVTEAGFVRVSPREAPVPVRDTLHHRLRYQVMMTGQCNLFVRLEPRVTSL